MGENIILKMATYNDWTENERKTAKKKNFEKLQKVWRSKI